MVIQHNMPAINANRQFGVVSDKRSSSAEKLSSGYKINRSADDAAGLSISEKMRKQIRGLNRAAENIEDGISYAQVADGALNEVHDMLQRINELSVQAANGTNSDSDRAHINNEVQQLKAEMERIFVTASFNERQIWKEDIVVNKGVLGQVSVQSTAISTPSSQRLVINHETYGLLPVSSPSRSAGDYDRDTSNSSSYYRILADDAGVNLTWSAYNGTTYKTKTIDWSTLRENDFKFNIGDYFENKDSSGNEITDPTKQLLNKDGNPKFGFDVSLDVVTGATNEQIALAINNTTMSQSLYTSLSIDSGQTLNDTGIKCTRTTFVYAAAYADTAARADAVLNQTSGSLFSDPPSDTISPYPGTGNLTSIPNQGISLAQAKNSTGKWQFTFKAEGLGNLIATSSRVTYVANDTDAYYVNKNGQKVTSWTTSKIVSPDAMYDLLQGRDKDDIKKGFLSLSYYDDNRDGLRHWSISRNRIPAGDGALGDVMKTLTGAQGLLSKNGAGGATDDGGVITLAFDIATTENNKYVYGKDADGNDLKSDIVGAFSLTIPVDKTDTEQTILKKINDAFNKNTLFDINFNSSITGQVSKSIPKKSTMLKNDFLPQDIIEDINLNIHSGSETTDKINLDYECLRLKTIGLADTNVLTQENALAAIDEISSALEIISAQRSLFGAYQNRMEHAYSIDKNSSENTQAAESQIRDTDMAEEMVQFSNLNILGQAGQSMLAQANQQNQGILNLLK